MRRTGRRRLLAVAATALLVGGVGMAARAQDNGVHYVALGDSYTSGPYPEAA
ncbi:MAG: hypothetical protein ACR2MO_05935 [Acidimicrobiales bacterium]